MIASIRGKLIRKSPTSVVIETGGVGFHLFIPVSSHSVLGDIGEEVTLLTHLHVRDDALLLFGFATSDERDLFLSLISVSGVGPKLAQSVLSGISVEDFYTAIQHHNVDTLSRVPGIGKKTAERLMVELKDKAGKFGHGLKIQPEAASIAEEGIGALLSLGYKRHLAESIVQKLLKQDASISVEILIRRALREM
ncbi:Holliday junction branch migration protein RuvA [bacterium]|nr:Holliday junction branch migration protein RuvA [bacterium]